MDAWGWSSGVSAGEVYLFSFLFDAAQSLLNSRPVQVDGDNWPLNQVNSFVVLMREVKTPPKANDPQHQRRPVRRAAIMEVAHEEDKGGQPPAHRYKRLQPFWSDAPPSITFFQEAPQKLLFKAHFHNRPFQTPDAVLSRLGHDSSRHR